MICLTISKVKIMKQFNLQEYLANPSRKVVTKSGCSVRILCTNAKGDCPVFGLALDTDGSEFPIMCAENGESEFEEEDDLFFDTVTNEGYVNIYKMPDTDGFEASCIFKTKEDARIFRGANYVATTKITWEEE